MKVIVHDVTEITRKLDITVPAVDVGEELEKIYQEIGRQAKLKGFRPGKIPREVLEQHFKQEAESDCIKHLVSSSYPEALRAAGTTPVSYPQIAIRHFQPGEDFTFEATVEVPPQLTIKGYDSLTLTRKKTQVSEHEVEAGLKALQERAAQLTPIPTPRKPRAGDIVVFNYRGMKDGKDLPQAKGEGHMVELGRGHLIPPFEEALMDMVPGEKRRVPVTLPQQGADPKGTPSTLHYDVTLRDLKEKHLPDLNDDFARDLGNFASLAEVREKIRQQIEKEKDQMERGQLAHQALQKLAEKNHVPIPDGMLQIELEAMRRNLESHLRSQGSNLEEAGITEEVFAQKNREEASFRVKGGLILGTIAKQEGIQIEPKAVDERIELMAKQAGQSPDAWKKYYREKNLLEGVETALREEKTLDFVLSKATIKIEE